MTTLSGKAWEARKQDMAKYKELQAKMRPDPAKPGGKIDPDAEKAFFEHMRAMGSRPADVNAEARRLVEPILTAEQKQKLAELRRTKAESALKGEIDVWMQRFSPADFTADQKQKIDELVKAARETLLATANPDDPRVRLPLIVQWLKDVRQLMTDEQKAKVDAAARSGGPSPRATP